MANLGSQLLTPETGYKRYDSEDTRISYKGTWTFPFGTTNSGRYFIGSTMRGTNIAGSSVTFKFSGTKLRIFALGGGTTSVYADKVHIQIDNDVDTTFSCRYGTTGGSNWGSYLVYDNIKLSSKTHTCILTFTETNCSFNFDGIDIDSNGFLFNYVFLIQDNNQIKSSSDGENLTYVDNLPYTKDKFTNNDMTISNVTPTVISKLVSQKYNIAMLR